MPPALLSGLITLGSGLLSGILGSGTSPSEEGFQKLFNELYNNMDFLKQTPFSKEELFQSILPAVQSTFRRSADVAAAKAGATIPESVGGSVPEGQGFMDFYINALAPIIAKGENLAGQANVNFVDLYNRMDSEAKQRFLQAIQLGGNLAGGLPGQTGGQKFFTNFLQGADIGSTIQGNIALGDALNSKANSLMGLLQNLLNGGTNGASGATGAGNSNILGTINQFLNNGNAGGNNTSLTPPAL